MVERYHELDDSVLREILGKKVTSKTRKDLDDVSELTHVPLRSCHRQYDNIQRYGRGALTAASMFRALPWVYVMRRYSIFTCFGHSCSSECDCL